MTIENVTRVINRIEGDKWWMVVDSLDIPLSPFEEIERMYSTDTERIHAALDYYVNYHPDASWEHLIEALYMREQFAAARESKSFMSTGKYCHYIT